MNLYEVFDNQISKMQEQLREADEKEAMLVRKCLIFWQDLEPIRKQQNNL